MKIAVEPASRSEFDDAIAASGGVRCEIARDVKALIWTDYSKPQQLHKLLDENPQIEWVQLPFAGVDAFADLIAREPLFTSAKGSYSEPVAEHALMLCLSLGRDIPKRVRAQSWGEKFAVSLYESRVLVVGSGGIANELKRLLEPFKNDVVLLGRNEISSLDEELPKADFVVLACALTDQTRGLFDADRFKLMKPTAYLVNVARGPVINTSDLIAALDSGFLAGAGLDVTDPEPLPEAHPLWNQPNVIITPHTADTDAQVVRMFADRIRENVAAYISGRELVGQVDKKLGY